VNATTLNPRRALRVGDKMFAGAKAVKRRVQFALFILLALLLAVLATGIAAARTLYRSAETHYVAFAMPLNDTTRDLLFQIEREQSGVRGYVITRNRTSLRPYFRGRHHVYEDLAVLGGLARDHRELEAPLEQVRQEVVALHGFYDRLIVFVADGRFGARQAQHEVLNGGTTSARLQHSAAVLQNAATTLVTRTQHDQRATYHRALATLLIAGALALAVAAWLLVKFPERLRFAYASEEGARRRAEQGANAAKALAHVAEAVVLIDDDAVVRYWNEGAERLFGVPTRNATGVAVSSVLRDYERLTDAAEREERFVPVTVDGDERWVTPAVAAFSGGRVLTVADATAAHTLERMRSEFVATASHELRTPLTTVFGGIQTLLAHRDALSRGQQEGLLQMMERESAHLVEIVDQLLISARLDRDALQVHAADVDIAALCRGVVESAQLRVGNRHVIMLQTPASMPLLRCDGALLRQILVNLVDNAVKYSANGGRVEVLVADEPTHVRIDVVDEGIGIPTLEQDRVFEKFYRVDPAMETGVGGSGLGLYISREIAQQMGGSLTLRSEPGQGSTFTLTLPREPST
jgi:signal transduction histidine kinase